MVILKLSPRVSDEYECEVTDNLENKNKYAHVRPCERYDELYRTCRSIRARFGQYYVYGELLDCSVHLRNYKSCLEYRRTKNPDALEPVVKWEKDLIEARMNTVNQNKVWEMRDSPPEFEAPLPDYIAQRQTGSLFAGRS